MKAPKQITHNSFNIFKEIHVVYVEEEGIKRVISVHKYKGDAENEANLRESLKLPYEKNIKFKTASINLTNIINSNDYENI